MNNNSVVKGFLKAIVILGVIYALVYFVSYNKWLHHDFDSIDYKYKEDDQNNKSDSNSTINFEKLYDKYKFEFLEENYGEEFFDMYYGGKNFNNDYYIYLGVITLIQDDIKANCDYEVEIGSKELKQTINSLFGNVSYKNKSFTTKNGYLDIKYDSVLDNYLVKVNKCSELDYSEGGIKNVFQEYLIEGNYLYIYEKAFYLDYSKGKNGVMDFNYHEGLDKESKVIANNLEAVDLKLVPTYIYKFKLDNKKYVLVSVTEK